MRMMGFTDTMSAGDTRSTICRVLREQDCQIAARTYRASTRAPVDARTLTDTHVIDAVRDVAFTTIVDGPGRRRRKLTPEGLNGRRKMTAWIRRTTIPSASRGAIDWARPFPLPEGVSRVWRESAETRPSARPSPTKTGSAPWTS